jgi:hypothetical protein
MLTVGDEAPAEPTETVQTVEIESNLNQEKEIVNITKTEN